MAEAPAAEADDVAQAVREVMVGACRPVCDLSVPLEVETGVGDSWAEIH